MKKRNLWTAWRSKSINDFLLSLKKEIPQGNSLADCLLNSKEVENYFSCYLSQGKMAVHVESDNTERLGQSGMGKGNCSIFCKLCQKSRWKRSQIGITLSWSNSITNVSQSSRILSVSGGQRQANSTCKKTIILKTIPFPSKTFLLLVLNSNFYFIRPNAHLEENHAYAPVQRWDLPKMSLEQGDRRTSHVLKVVWTTDFVIHQCSQCWNQTVSATVRTSCTQGEESFLAAAQSPGICTRRTWQGGWV